MALPEHLQRFNDEPRKVLNDGHVQLIDVMGDDMAIVDAARVSYGAGTKRVSKDRHLIRYLMRHRHCYDDQTEVLTEHGFMPWPEVQEGTKLGIWDNEAGTLCYEVPEYLTRDPYEGDMYWVEHGGVDLLVTPDHKMWVRLKDQWDAASKSQGWSGFRLIPANELGDRSMVRYSKLAPMVAPMWAGEGFPDCKDPQALLELIGFFIGDGSARGTRANGIDFHLKKQREIDFLKDCVARVGWAMREFSSYEGHRRVFHQFCVYAEGIGHLFEQMFYWNDDKKHLPDWCLRLDQDDAASLLNGMRHSDGSEKRGGDVLRHAVPGRPGRSGAWVYYTGSARLAEQVQILGLHAGEACHIGMTPNSPSVPCAPEYRKPNDDSIENTPPDPMYRVMFLSRMREPVVNQGQVQTSTVPYKGNVYCAKTRTGILVVRRNGKIVLSGNTTPFEMCEFKIRVRVPMDAWRQWIRHRTASVNEYSTRYSQAIDSAQTAGGNWRAQAASNKQGSSGFVEAWAEGFQFPKSYLHDGEEVTVEELGVSNYLSHRERLHHSLSREIYEERLALGVAREVARKDLPLSTYTEAYWKMDLHNLFHFLGLRMDPHAQLEIRSYANAVAEMVKAWVPWAWEAFEDYRLHAMHLTRFEVEGLRTLLRSMRLRLPIPSLARQGATYDDAVAALLGVALEGSGLPKPQEGKKEPREVAEFKAKIQRLL